MKPRLTELKNAIVVPHIASASNVIIINPNPYNIGKFQPVTSVLRALVKKLIVKSFLLGDTIAFSMFFCASL